MQDKTMQDILSNFLKAGQLNETAVAECGMQEMGGAAPVSVNISGEAGDIAAMLKMLSGAEAPKPMTAIPMDDPEIPGRDDVDGDQDLDAGMLGSIAGGALGTMAGTAIGGPVGGAIGGAAGSALGDKLTGGGDDEADESYGDEMDNEPEEEYMDTDDVLPSGDDLHRKKPLKAMRVKDPAVESSIKDRLWAALNEKKAEL